MKDIVINKEALIKGVSKKTFGGISKREMVEHNKLTEASVDFFFKAIESALSSNERVEFRNFGCFSVKKLKTYQGVNPKTRERIEIKSRKMPVFKASKKVKNELIQKAKK